MISRRRFNRQQDEPGASRRVGIFGILGVLFGVLIFRKKKSNEK